MYSTVCEKTGMVPISTAAFDNLRLELRRGSLVVAVLATLRTEQYGYTLRKTLAEHGLEVDENTLYPAAPTNREPGIARQRVARGEQAQEAVLPAFRRRGADARTTARRVAGHGFIFERNSRRKCVEMIERYLNAIEFWLPAKQKQDIIAEISEDLRFANGGDGRTARP